MDKSTSITEDAYLPSESKFENLQFGTNIEKNIPPVTADFDKSKRRNLLVYLVVSALAFAYLVAPRWTAISVPLFALLQIGFAFFLLPCRKILWLWIPIFILALNAFVSANPMWRMSNFFVTLPMRNHCCFACILVLSYVLILFR